MSDTIELVVGLGNPGPKYDRTRHNVGFWFVDRVAEKLNESFREQSRIQGELASARVGANKVYLLKPNTFMNLSGNSVSASTNYYRIATASVLIVHDELDLPAGTIRIKRGGGHGGHNGLRDIIQHIGADFLRLRIGVGDPVHPSRGANFVLTAPPAEQKSAIENAIDRVFGEFENVINGQINQAMNIINRKSSDNGD